MKKFFLYIVIFLSGSHTLALAQSDRSGTTDDFRNGEKEFANQRYTFAIAFYKTSLKHKKSNDSLAIHRIAEAYWYIKNYDSALAYYQKFESKYGYMFSSSQRLAELLANHKKYADAAKIYKKLTEKIPAKNIDLLEERLKGFSNPKPFLRDSLDYSISLLKLNTQQQDFSPQFFMRGMVFVSSRYSKKASEKEFGWDGLPFASVYWVKDTAELYTTDMIAGYTSQSDRRSIKVNDDYTSRTSNDNDILIGTNRSSAYTGTIHKLAKYSDMLNAKYNYGPLCFNKKGDKVYFTRNTLSPNKGSYNLEICEATLLKGHWGNIHVMPFVKPEYDYYHPALSSDEKRLYFCSNMAGGIGGSDIYYVSLAIDFAMTVPINMYNKINSAGNELFPTISGDTLYFSSDGFAGLGGLDIYKTYIGRGSSNAPVNLGYPVNSSFDDFGIIFNAGRTKGFFSSNRLGTDDIYVFENAPFIIQLQGTVLSKTTLQRLDQAKVVMWSTDEDKPAIDSFFTDLTGNFHFPIRPGQGYTLQFTRNGYVEDSLLITNTGIQKVLVLQPVLLTTLRSTPPVVIVKGRTDIQAKINELAKMVFFDRDKDNILPTSLKPLNEIVDVLRQYPNTTLLIEGHTDSKLSAAHNMDLSKRRSNSVKTFFVNNGLKASRFQTRGYGPERPVADNNTVEGRALNRRVEMKATFIY